MNVLKGNFDQHGLGLYILINMAQWLNWRYAGANVQRSALKFPKKYLIMLFSILFQFIIFINMLSKSI